MQQEGCSVDSCRGRGHQLRQEGEDEGDSRPACLGNVPLQTEGSMLPYGSYPGSYPGGRYYLFSRPPKRVNFSPDNSVYVNIVAVFMIL